MTKKIPKIEYMFCGIRHIRVETDKYIDGKRAKITLQNCPKRGDKWYADIFIEPNSLDK